jgi:hypothetical protein
MTRNEIVAELLKLLDMHLKGARGYMGQRGYKEDFFKLFKDAYSAGHFTPAPNMRADNLRDELLVRWSSLTQGQENDKIRLIEQWSTMWDEWRYALDNYP